MPKLTLMVILATVLMSLIAPTAQADPRPFAPYLWGADTDTPYWAIEFGQDKQVGQILDGLMIKPEFIGDGGRIFFIHENENVFVKPKDVVGDPRGSKWWQGTVYRFSAPNLRAMVTEAASAKSCPDGEKVVALILTDMVARGYATKDEVGKNHLSLVRTREIMVDYTRELEIPVF